MDIARLKKTDRLRITNQERLKEEASMLIYKLMEQDEVRRSELAQRLGKSKPHVTKLLDQSHNFTLETLADVCLALDHAVHFYATPNDPLHLRAATVLGEAPSTIASTLNLSIGRRQLSNHSISDTTVA